MSISPDPDPGERRGLWHPSLPWRPDRWPFFYGWVVTAVGTVGVIASIPAQTYGVGVFVEVLIEALGLTRTELSLAYLMATLASGLLLPMGGRWMDRFGLRKVAVLSIFLLGVSLIILSLSDHLANGLAMVPGFGSLPWLAPFLIVLGGFFLIRFWGQGMLTLSSRNMVGKWFQYRRGLAVGISGVAAGIAFSASPSILHGLIQWLGWRESWLLLGILLLGPLAFVMWALARDNPEECGLEMDGGKGGEEPASTNPDLYIHHEYSRTEALRTFSYWVFSLSFAWHALFITAYAFHVADIGRSLGLEEGRIFLLFLYAAAISIPTNLFVGWISPHIRLKWCLVLMNISTLGLAGGLAMGGPAVAVVIVVTLGVSGGLWGNMQGQVYARYFGRARLGAITGHAMSMIVIGSALGPYLFGLSNAFLGTYAGAYLAALFISGALSTLALRANNPQRRARA